MHRALELQSLAGELAVAVRERDGLDLRLRVGLNSGEVVAGDFGSATAKYTAIGHTVGMAQRMESAAGPGEVLALPRPRVWSNAPHTLVRGTPLGQGIRRAGRGAAPERRRF